MQAIRTIIWVMLAVLLTLFAVINSEIVAVRLLPGEGGTIAEMPLALVIVASFLIGFLPMFLAYRTAKWTGERKVRQQEETIAMLRPQPTPVPTYSDQGLASAPPTASTTDPLP